MRKRILWGALLALGAAFAPAPAPAFPPGPPTVALDVRATGDALVYDLSAFAYDPDGPILAIEICPGDGSACALEQYAPPDLVGSVGRCLDGEARETAVVSHRFPAYGTYEVTARVVAGGCPVLGAEEEDTTSWTLEITPPPPPIPCGPGGGPGGPAPGVEPDRIRIAAVGAISGPLASSLGPAVRGISAAVDRVNVTGGVCDRQIELSIFDDGFDTERGRQIIQNLIADGETFAFVAMPSAPGLQAAIRAGDIDAAGIPVVGTLALRADEFTNPWVWPAAPSNADFGEVAVRHAYAAGARSIAIVWDDLVGGDETREAVYATAEQLPGASVKGDRRTTVIESDYFTVLTDLQRQCGDRMCDALILAIDSISVIKLGHASRAMAIRAPVVTSVTPWAMNTSTFRDCGDACDSWVSWTGFEPPIGQAGPAAEQYERDLRRLFPGADTDNALTEGAYAGAMLLAHAIGRAGPAPTRAKLRHELDHTTFDLGLTGELLDWRQTRFANRTLRGYESIATAGGFTGFRRATDWIAATN